MANRKPVAEVFANETLGQLVKEQPPCPISRCWTAVRAGTMNRSQT